MALLPFDTWFQGAPVLQLSQTGGFDFWFHGAPTLVAGGPRNFLEFVNLPSASAFTPVAVLGGAPSIVFGDTPAGFSLMAHVATAPTVVFDVVSGFFLDGVFAFHGAVTLDAAIAWVPWYAALGEVPFSSSSQLGVYDGRWTLADILSGDFWEIVDVVPTTVWVLVEVATGSVWNVVDVLPSTTWTPSDAPPGTVWIQVDASA